MIYKKLLQIPASSICCSLFPGWSWPLRDLDVLKLDIIYNDSCFAVELKGNTLAFGLSKPIWNQRVSTTDEYVLSQNLLTAQTQPVHRCAA